jgi:predicted ArsR family transcriptional regulator
MTHKTFARHLLLVQLRRERAASAADLALVLHTSAANVRHHLSVLQADGLVDQIAIRHKGKRGRPVKIFGLSRTQVGDNLERLTDVVLEEWRRGLSSEGRQTGLRSLAFQLVGENVLTGPMTRRLPAVMGQLNTMHYEAHWEAYASGPRVVFDNCPYAAIIASHPELCQMDGFILERLLGMPFRQIAKLEVGLKGLPFCAFAVKD